MGRRLSLEDFMKGNMKKILIILTATLLITLTAKGQNLFFIGEKSYPCTETFTLQSNSGEGHNLNVRIAKDGTKGLFAVTVISMDGTLFGGKLIIYLDDGTVITCIDKGKSEYVDDAAKAVYSLTNEQLSKMKNSDINTVRYTLNLMGMKKVNRSASNKGSSTKIDFPALITEFFD